MASDRDMAGVFNLKASFPSEDEKKSFFSAAQENKIGAVEKILKRFPDAALTWRNDSGVGVIPAACAKLEPKTLAFLLKAGADIDDRGTPENRTWSAMQTAAYHGDAATLEMLLSAGAKIDLMSKYGETPLMDAVDEEKPACVDLLVLAGADPNLPGERYRKTALDKCKSQQMRDVIAAAQKRRADFLAGNPQALKPAFVPPTPPPARDMAPLLALRAGFPTDDEKKAFFKAAGENDIRALRRTLEKFPEAALKWRDDSGNAVIAAAGSKLEPDTLKLLQDRGADIDDSGTPENRTWPALHAAAYFGRLDDVAMLLQRGAKVDVTNKYGDTPLVYAVDEGQRACVDLLVLAGADPDLKREGRSSAWDKSNAELREIIKAAKEKRALFLAGLPPGERPRFVPPAPPVPEPSTVKIVKRIDLRFQI